MLWMVDSFVGFYLTLPTRRAPNPSRPAIVERQLKKSFWTRWKPPWKVKTSGSPYIASVDLHRAFSLWTFGLLFILAFTAFSLNFYREVFFPVMSMVSTVPPNPFTERAPKQTNEPIEPKLTFEEILKNGEGEAIRRGWTTPAGACQSDLETRHRQQVRDATVSRMSDGPRVG